MRKTILTLVAMLLTTSAYATSPKPNTNNVINNNHNNPTAIAGASAKASATAAAIAAQKQSQHQYQSQSTRQYQTNRQTTKQSNDQQNQQVYNHNEQRPSGIAPSIGLGGFASGPCVGVTTQGGFGVGLPGGASFGGSAGRSELDDECTRRETARILHAMGQADLAVKIMLASPVVKAVMQPATITPTAATISNTQHPACSPSSWATREWRAANCQ